MSSGYSGTPLARKLGIKERHLEPDAEGGALDLAILFVFGEEELRSQLPAIVSRLTVEGGVWVAWPKASS